MNVFSNNENIVRNITGLIKKKSMKNLNKNIEKVKIYVVINCFENPNKVYIGKTKNSREKDHKKIYGNNIEYFYVDEVESLNHKDWEPLETYWIEQFRQWGFEIMNKRNVEKEEVVPISIQKKQNKK